MRWRWTPRSPRTAAGSAASVAPASSLRRRPVTRPPLSISPTHAASSRSAEPAAVLRDRVVTAVVLIAILVAALFMLPAVGWMAVCILVLAAGGWEWAGFIRAGTGTRVAYTALTLAAASALAHVTGLDAGSPD